MKVKLTFRRGERTVEIEVELQECLFQYISEGLSTKDLIRIVDLQSANKGYYLTTIEMK